jgi:hypothetical protein
LVFQTKFIFNSFIGIGKLSVYDGGTKCVELDLFHSLVANWFDNLFWIQSKKQ